MDNQQKKAVIVECLRQASNSGLDIGAAARFGKNIVERYGLRTDDVAQLLAAGNEMRYTTTELENAIRHVKHS